MMAYFFKSVYMLIKCGKNYVSDLLNDYTETEYYFSDSIYDYCAVFYYMQALDTKYYLLVEIALMIYDYKYIIVNETGTVILCFFGIHF